MLEDEPSGLTMEELETFRRELSSCTIQANGNNCVSDEINLDGILENYDEEIDKDNNDANVGEDMDIADHGDPSLHLQPNDCEPWELMTASHGNTILD